MSSQDKGSKGGFPIRRSLDQSSFAAPQGLSQRTTSFIASQRQGIHQMLLRHLIALMIHVRTLGRGRHGYKKDLLSSFHSRALLAEHTRTTTLRGPKLVGGLGRLTNRVCSLFTISNIRKKPALSSRPREPHGHQTPRQP